MSVQNIFFFVTHKLAKKLECSLQRQFQPRSVFEVKVAAYPSGAFLRFSYLGQAPGTAFITLHFLHDLQMCPNKLECCIKKNGKACQGQTLQLSECIREC
jgi:hypothetical protein